MFDALLKRISAHISSFTLVAALMGYYLLGEHGWLNAFLPINGKPLVVFILIAVVILYELVTKGHANLTAQISAVAVQIEINAVTGAVAGLYRQYVSSDNEFITDESTIQEIHATYDNLRRLGINSYNQRKIEFLVSKIHLDKRINSQ